MLELLSPVVLAPGVKGFFENPGFLLGTPLVILGVIGLMIMLLPIELRWPVPSMAAAEPQVEAEVLDIEVHPGPKEYVTVGLILAVVTIVEVALYYIDIAQGALLGMLLVLSAVKFVLVVLWFMHLQFDSPLFSTLFTGGMMLVLALFIIVLASLGASLV